jgi:hypothetical protein
VSKEVFVWLVVAICICVAFVSDLKLGPDNPIEEASEIIIKQETGIDVDLSPSTKEK